MCGHEYNSAVRMEEQAEVVAEVCVLNIVVLIAATFPAQPRALSPQCATHLAEITFHDRLLIFAYLSSDFQNVDEHVS